MSRVFLSLVCIVVMVAGASAATLEVYLPMNGNLNDASGNGRNATVVDRAAGTHAFAAGMQGLGLDLGTVYDDLGMSVDDYRTVLQDALLKTSNDYVAIPKVTAMTASGSIAMWYKTSSLHFNYECPWDNVAGVSRDYDRWECWIDNAAPSQMYVRASERHYSSDPLLRDHQMTQINALGVDTWIHVATTWQQSADLLTCELKMYINGELVDTATDVPWEQDPGQFCLGGGNDGNNLSIGAYDEVRFYSGVLTGAEVQALMVPEPGTLVLLLAGGLAAVALFRRRNG